MSEMKWILVAGPYTTGAPSVEDRALNLRVLNEAAVAVLRKGHLPVIGVNLANPMIEAAGADCFDEIMMPVSLALADRCDAVLRIGGASVGADEEVERIRLRGGEVYRSLSQIP